MPAAQLQFSQLTPPSESDVPFSVLLLIPPKFTQDDSYRTLSTVSNPSRMMKVPNAASLASISIPLNTSPLSPDNLGASADTLTAPLNGIRMFDIHLRINAGSTFVTHHGTVYQKELWFQSDLENIDETLTIIPQCLAEIVNTRTFSSSTPIPSLPAYIFRAADLIAPKDAPDYPLLPEEDNSYMLDDAEKESLLFLDTPFVALLLPFAIVPARIARINPDYIIGLLRKSLFAFRIFAKSRPFVPQSPIQTQLVVALFGVIKAIPPHLVDKNWFDLDPTLLNLDPLPAHKLPVNFALPRFQLVHPRPRFVQLVVDKEDEARFRVLWAKEVYDFAHFLGVQPKSSRSFPIELLKKAILGALPILGTRLPINFALPVTSTPSDESGPFPQFGEDSFRTRVEEVDGTDEGRSPLVRPARFRRSRSRASSRGRTPAPRSLGEIDLDPEGDSLIPAIEQMPEPVDENPEVVGGQDGDGGGGGGGVDDGEDEIEEDVPLANRRGRRSTRPDGSASNPRPTKRMRGRSSTKGKGRATSRTPSRTRSPDGDPKRLPTRKRGRGEKSGKEPFDSLNPTPPVNVRGLIDALTPYPSAADFRCTNCVSFKRKCGATSAGTRCPACVSHGNSSCSLNDPSAGLNQAIHKASSDRQQYSRLIAALADAEAQLTESTTAVRVLLGYQLKFFPQQDLADLHQVPGEAQELYTTLLNVAALQSKGGVHVEPALIGRLTARWDLTPLKESEVNILKAMVERMKSQQVENAEEPNAGPTSRPPTPMDDL
ncbi:hypothetical protein C8R44DRAFT_895709 [Mycena epipterygia]|nr:hypothetical protein C8R44DRAFT_895709 [Mycena epipterygia]